MGGLSQGSSKHKETCEDLGNYKEFELIRLVIDYMQGKKAGEE